MKKMKLFAAAAMMAMVATAGFTGYMVYDKATMTDQEKMFQANLEALTREEDNSGEYLTCYCALASDANCAVNNNGSSKCAGGVNIKCWEYDRNCN